MFAQLLDELRGLIYRIGDFVHFRRRTLHHIAALRGQFALSATWPMLVVTSSTAAAIDAVASLWLCDLMATRCDDSESLPAACMTPRELETTCRMISWKLWITWLKEWPIRPISSPEAMLTRRDRSLLVWIWCMAFSSSFSDRVIRRIIIIMPPPTSAVIARMMPISQVAWFQKILS